MPLRKTGSRCNCAVSEVSLPAVKCIYGNTRAGSFE